jgi:hypothetical protein
LSSGAFFFSWSRKLTVRSSCRWLREHDRSRVPFRLLGRWEA